MISIANMHISSNDVVLVRPQTLQLRQPYKKKLYKRLNATYSDTTRTHRKATISHVATIRSTKNSCASSLSLALQRQQQCEYNDVKQKGARKRRERARNPCVAAAAGGICSRTITARQRDFHFPFFSVYSGVGGGERHQGRENHFNTRVSSSGVHNAACITHVPREREREREREHWIALAPTSDI